MYWCSTLLIPAIRKEKQVDESLWGEVSLVYIMKHCLKTSKTDKAHLKLYYLNISVYNKQAEFLVKNPYKENRSPE